MTTDTPEALRYATHLATALWEKHWKDEAPHWKPLPDLMGLLTQIDNATAGLRKSPENANDGHLNGSRTLPYSRDELGRMVREAWVRWAKTQPNPKPSWLLPYDELSEQDREADRQIGEAVARWTLIGDASRNALSPNSGP